MSQYTPTSGRVLEVQWQTTTPALAGCGITLTLQTFDQGIVRMNVDGSTYVLNHHPIKAGDQVTCFYSLFDPVPLIYPPLYRAAAVALTPAGTYATLDVFTNSTSSRQLTNSDDTLRLNISSQTRQMLPNGQPFGGSLSGKLLLVIYGTTTRSIPAQTTPEKIVVFCEGIK